MAGQTIVVQPTAKFAVLEVRCTRYACVHHAALDVLTTPEPATKARKSFDAYDAWQRGELTAECPDVVEHPRGGRVCVYASQVPDRPARPANMQVVGMSRVKTGKSKYTIHAVAHAESYAIDLMWDLILRCVILHAAWAWTRKVARNTVDRRVVPFSHRRFGPSYKMPLDFYNDFVRIAAEEAAHFQSWADRLVEMGSYYGEFPCHDGLWEDAAATSDDLLARLALVHMVHEARGLDVFPASRQVCSWVRSSICCYTLRVFKDAVVLLHNFFSFG